MKRKILLSLVLVILLVLGFVFLRPIPIVTEEEALITKAVVTHIFEGGVRDIVFQVKNSDQGFYINRGMEKGLKINELREKMLGETVTFYYPDFWTPMDWNNKFIHVSKVEVKGEVVFNELKP